MIKVSVFYPNKEGCKFDMDYYCNNHGPMLQEKLGMALKGVAVEQGLSGAEPGSQATYVAMAIYYSIQWRRFRAPLDPTPRRSWEIYQTIRTSSPRSRLAK